MGPLDVLGRREGGSEEVALPGAALPVRLRTRGARSLRRRALFIAAVAGPGLIAAAAGNDAGGIVTYSSAGAEYVYRTLFLMLLIGLGLALVQEMSARLGAITGKGLAALIREEFSIRLTFLALGALVIANVGIVVSEFAGIGTAFELFHVTRFITVPLSAAAIWLLVLLGSYRYAERVFLLLTLAFFAYPIAAVLAHPNWRAVGLSVVLPHFFASKGYVLLAVALIGTTISPYMQLYNASAVVDRGIGPDEVRFARIDAVAGALFATVISWSIIIATGAAIGGTGVLQSALKAAEALRPVAGSGATILFGLGLLGASALAGAVVPLSTSYAIAEAIGVERSVSRSFREAPLFLGLFTAQVVIGVIVTLMPINLIALLIGTQVVEGVVTPITLAFIVILANRKSVLGSYANGPVMRVVAGIVTVVIAVMAIALVVMTVLGWFGIS
ncbi:MAG: NRAMP family divalent metal transporter [Acidimicrobiales bacterium]|jgi:Mn2+/Fe2+ NRAMP family transporter